MSRNKKISYNDLLKIEEQINFADRLQTILDDIYKVNENKSASVIGYTPDKKVYFYTDNSVLNYAEFEINEDKVSIKNISQVDVEKENFDKEFKTLVSEAIDKFAEKHNHYNPPTTEITSLRNEKACVSYIATYLSKKDRYKKKLAHYLQKPKVITTSENIQYSPLPKDYYENLKRRNDGKIWDCSLSLKKAPVCSWTMKNEDFWLLKRIERTFPERMIYKDTFQFLPLSEYEITKKLPTQYTQKYLKWIKRIKLGNKKHKISFETQERLKTFKTKEKTLCTLNFLNGCPLSLN